jgi:hypothetical protein
MGRERPDALFVATTPFLNARAVQLAQLAAFHRLPAIYGLLPDKLLVAADEVIE